MPDQTTQSPPPPATEKKEIDYLVEAQRKLKSIKEFSPKELFDKLARDEVQHKAYLQTVIGSYEEKGVAAFNMHLRDPDLKAFTGTIFTDEFKSQAKGADFELGVLSIGMTLETNAIKYFAGAADNTSEHEVRDFYRFLADWEREHLEALQALYNGVRQDFWSDGGFSPF